MREEGGPAAPRPRRDPGVGLRGRSSLGARGAWRGAGTGHRLVLLKHLVKPHARSLGLRDPAEMGPAPSLRPPPLRAPQAPGFPETLGRVAVGSASGRRRAPICSCIWAGLGPRAPPGRRVPERQVPAGWAETRRPWAPSQGAGWGVPRPHFFPLGSGEWCWRGREGRVEDSQTPSSPPTARG